MRTRTCPWLLAIVLLVAATSVARADGAKPEAAGLEAAIGKQISNFSLEDYRGRQHKLSEFTDARAIVVMFFGVECPLAKVYATRLAEIAAKYEPQKVVFLGLDANRQDSVTEIAAFAKQHNLNFPLLRDSGNRVADEFLAQRTPTVYVLDATRSVRYAGRIDDQYSFETGVGYTRPRLSRHDLTEAIDEVLEGEPVSVATTEAVGCLIGRVREADSASPVTYSNQIARIFQKHCVECHREGEIGPFQLTNYEEVVGWAEMIGEVVRDQRMPPWHADPKFGKFRNDHSLSSDEKEQIAAWVAAGAPEGDRSQLPEPVEYTVGWGIGEPEFVAYMDEKPYQLPAEGTIDYQYFVVDPGFKEDRWVSAAECRAGNREVVHHIFVFMVPPGVDLPDFRAAERGEAPRDRDGERGFNPGSNGVQLIAGTAPGNPPVIYPPGMATYMPAGCRLVFQMHYTASGVPTEDRSCVGFQFADPRTVKQACRMNMAINFQFSIPPGADNHPVEASYTFNRDSMILGFTPHMHLRGKAFRYDLRYPDGKVETVLDVPRYDSNWQVTYQLAEPIRAPAGSELYCLAHFDNSSENPANPDSSITVRWGDQTWEEMMIGWFGETTDVDTGLLPRAEQRVALFERERGGKPLEVKAFVTRLAGKSLASEDAFDKFVRRVQKDVPQIDRVCVATVDDGAIKFLQIAEPETMRLALASLDSSWSADGSALSAIAAAGEVRLVPRLKEAPEADLQAAAARLRSSMHVGVEIDGRRAVVSFWSIEEDAFPKAAADYLAAIARSVGGAPNVATQAGQ